MVNDRVFGLMDDEEYQNIYLAIDWSKSGAIPDDALWVIGAIDSENHARLLLSDESLRRLRNIITEAINKREEQRGDWIDE